MKRFLGLVLLALATVAHADGTTKPRVTFIDKYYDGEAHRVTIEFPYLLRGTGTAYCLEQSRCTGLTVGTEVAFVRVTGEDDPDLPNSTITQKNLRYGESSRPVCSILCTTDAEKGKFGHP